MSKKKTPKLTKKQEVFVYEYIRTGNARQSAKVAGFAKSHAEKNSHKILEYPQVKEAIRREMSKIRNKSIAGAEEILEYLTSVMRGESLSEVYTTVMIGGGRSEIKRFYKHPDEKERIKAAELLGRRYALFETETTLNIKGAVKIVDDA